MKDMSRSAFPLPDGALVEGREGMSLRDWFAGMAVQGMMTNVCGILGEQFSPYAKGPCNAEITARAYAVADAMLKTREISP